MRATFPSTTESAGPTSQSAIQGFESRYGVALPSLYVDFLLTTNGGKPDNIVYPITGLALNPWGSLHAFLALPPAPDFNNLDRYMKLFGERIPVGIIPIAVNGGVDYVCLDLRNGGEKVVFWDHAHFWSTGEWRESDLYFIANSFDSFLKSLRPNPYK